VIAPQTQAVISNRELSFAVGTHVSGLVHDAVPANNTFGVTTTLTNSPPIVTTLAVTGVGETTATLAGTVNPHGVDTTYHFEYGASSAYGTSTPVRNAGSGTADLPVAEPLSGLPRGTTFHYRLVATSGSGTTTGADATFRTQFQCIVPAVKRKSLRAAKRALRRAHCAPGRVRRVRSRVRRGLVISQRPHPGARLREGGRVNLVVSLGRKR
jgi:hypothetical protein